MTNRLWYPAVLLAVLAAGTASAQADKSPKPPEEWRFYRVDFVFKELDGGSVVNTRSHTMILSSENRSGSVRTGNRVPVKADGGNNFNYIDVGMNIDCRVAFASPSQLVLGIVTDVSSVVSEPSAPAPVIRQLKWNSEVLIPVGKPTVVFTSDDPTSKHQMRLELTAAPIAQVTH